MYREKGIVFDPEGILSTLPSIVNVIAGYLAGKLIQQKGKSQQTVRTLVIFGVMLIPLALLWHSVFPINKKLWTSSFVVLTVGIDLLWLGILFYFIALLEWKRGVYFFTVFGRNPLFIYVLSNLLGIFFIFRVAGNTIFIDWINKLFFQRIAPGPVGCLLFALSYTLLCWSIGWILDRKKIYIKL